MNCKALLPTTALQPAPKQPCPLCLVNEETASVSIIEGARQYYSQENQCPQCGALTCGECVGLCKEEGIMPCCQRCDYDVEQVPMLEKCRLLRELVQGPTFSALTTAQQAAAEYNLGKLTLVVDHNFDEAVRLLKLAGQKGLGAAYADLGLIWSEPPDGRMADLEAALAFYKLGAERDERESLRALGEIYCVGNGPWGKLVAVDAATGFKYFERAAIQGDDHSQYVIGRMLKEGQGAEVDPAGAARWLRLAALQGNLDAYAIGYPFPDEHEWPAKSKWMGNRHDGNLYDDPQAKITPPYSVRSPTIFQIGGQIPPSEALTDFRGPADPEALRLHQQHGVETGRVVMPIARYSPLHHYPSVHRDRMLVPWAFSDRATFCSTCMQADSVELQRRIASVSGVAHGRHAFYSAAVQRVLKEV